MIKSNHWFSSKLYWFHRVDKFVNTLAESLFRLSNHCMGLKWELKSGFTVFSSVESYREY